MECYQKTERKPRWSVYRGLIVNQNLKNVSAIRENELACSSQSSSMAQTIRNSKMRYSSKSTPEERRPSKFEYVDNIDNSSSEEEPPAVCAANKAESKATEPWTAGPSTETYRADIPKKRETKRRKRGKDYAKEANQEHTKMCNKTMLMIDKINSFIDKSDWSNDWLSDWSFPMFGKPLIMRYTHIII
jgi:hypothetical protein